MGVAASTAAEESGCGWNMCDFEKKTTQASDYMLRAAPQRSVSPQKEAEATDYMRGVPDTRENSKKQAELGGADMQTQFALKMGQAATEHPQDSKLKMHAVFLLSTLSIDQQEVYVKMLPTRCKIPLADMVADVYRQMQAESVGNRASIIDKELKLSTDVERKTAFLFFDEAKLFKHVDKALRRTSTVMRITGDGVEKPTMRRRSSSFRASNGSPGEMTPPGPGSSSSLSRNDSFGSIGGDPTSPLASGKTGSFNDRGKQGRMRFNSAGEAVGPDMSFGGSFGKKAGGRSRISSVDSGSASGSFITRSRLNSLNE